MGHIVVDLLADQDPLRRIVRRRIHALVSRVAAKAISVPLLSLSMAMAVSAQDSINPALLAKAKAGKADAEFYLEKWGSGMSAGRPRRPAGPILYVVFWIGAVLVSLGFLGNLPHLIPDFLRDYSRDKGSAFEVLLGQMIVWAIGVFCILEIVDTRKARKSQIAKTTLENDATSPAAAPSSQPTCGNAESLDVLKEELFALESENLSGKVTSEEYEKRHAALEILIIRKHDPPISDNQPPALADLGREQVPEETKSGRVGVAIRIAAPLALTALLTFRRQGFSAETLGFSIGTMAIPFLVAYAITWRERGWIKFSYWFLALGILLPIATSPKSLTNLSPSDMTKELIGAKPLEDNLPENQKEMASATKAFFADAAAFRKSQDAKLAALAPDLRQLYSNDSFSSKEAMQKSLNVVDNKLQLDRETSSELDRMPEMMQARLDQTSLSDADKKSYLDGFMKGFNNSAYLSARKQMMIVESDWADSVRELYMYSLQHASQIVVTKDHIGIDSDAIREQFNAKLTRSGTLRDDFVAAATKVDELQAANTKKQGLSQADLDSIK